MPCRTDYSSTGTRVRAREKAKVDNTKFPRDTLIKPLIMLINNGVPVKIFIDVGVADGTFGLPVFDAVNPSLHLLNIGA